jgi:hypothetical protein
MIVPFLLCRSCRVQVSPSCGSAADDDRAAQLAAVNFLAIGLDDDIWHLMIIEPLRLGRSNFSQSLDELGRTIFGGGAYIPSFSDPIPGVQTKLWRADHFQRGNDFIQ